MSARPDLADGVEAELVGGEGERLEQLGEHLQHLDVDDELLLRRREAALQPAGAVEEDVAAAQHRAPERHLRFVGGLRVGNVGGVDVRAAPGQAEEAGELAADQRRLHRFRRAEGRRAALHVDVRGEGAVGDRRAGPDELRQRDAEQRLGVLLHQRAENGDRRHGAGQRERRDDAELAGAGEIDDAERHRDVELQRRVGVDDGVGSRASRANSSSLRPRAMRNIAKQSATWRRAAREDERHLVGQRELRVRDLEMADRPPARRAARRIG